MIIDDDLRFFLEHLVLMFCKQQPHDSNNILFSIFQYLLFRNIYLRKMKIIDVSYLKPNLNGFSLEFTFCVLIENNMKWVYSLSSSIKGTIHFMGFVNIQYPFSSTPLIFLMSCTQSFRRLDISLNSMKRYEIFFST